MRERQRYKATNNAGNSYILSGIPTEAVNEVINRVKQFNRSYTVEWLMPDSRMSAVLPAFKYPLRTPDIVEGSQHAVNEIKRRLLQALYDDQARIDWFWATFEKETPS